MVFIPWKMEKHSSPLVLLAAIVAFVLPLEEILYVQVLPMPPNKEKVGNGT